MGQKLSSQLKKSCISDELLTDEDQKMRIAPLLTQFEIPLQPKVLSVVLQEIVQIHNRFPNESILQYSNWNGKTTRVVHKALSVPVSPATLAH